MINIDIKKTGEEWTVVAKLPDSTKTYTVSSVDELVDTIGRLNKAVECYAVLQQHGFTKQTIAKIKPLKKTVTMYSLTKEQINNGV